MLNLNNNAIVPETKNFAMANPPSVGVKTTFPNVQTQPTNTTTQPAKPTPDPAIMAEQKALISKGATNIDGTPLQADGILGKNTLAARTKYANSSNTGSTTGTPTDTTDYKSLYEKQQADSAKGYQPTDNGLYGKLVTDLANRSSQGNPDYQRIQDERTALANDYSDKSNNIAGTAGFLTQQTGLQGLLNNKYNLAQNTLSNELSESNKQEQLRQGALGTAIGASAPQFPSYFNPQFNPVTNTYSQTGGGPTEGATKQFQADTTKTYLQGKQNLAAADGIQSQIIGTLKSNPALNTTPVTAITNLNEILSGQISTGPQQLLSQQIKQYIDTLGLDPATVNNIAHQQRGTLGQLLDSLRQTAETQNESKNPTNVQTSGTNNSNGGSSTTAGGLNFKLVNGKWVAA